MTPTRRSKALKGFVAKAAGEGEAVSARNTFARVLNDCFGVSMPQRWRAARKQVNPSENATVPERPRSCHASQPRRMPPPVARKNTPRSVSAGLPRSSARRFVGQPDAVSVSHRLKVSTALRADDRRPMASPERRMSADLRPGAAFSGEALVFQMDSTTYVPAGWNARVDGYLNLLLERE